FVLPGGRQALSYSIDQTARVWDLGTGKEVSSLDVGPSLSDIRGLALSPDGKRILVGGHRSNEARLIELVTGKEIHRFELAAPAPGPLARRLRAASPPRHRPRRAAGGTETVRADRPRRRRPGGRRGPAPGRLPPAARLERPHRVRLRRLRRPGAFRLRRGGVR